MGRTKERSAEDTRRLILQVASTVFTEHGLSASLELIAQQAGISKGGLKYHFSSKQKLIDALAHHIIQEYHDDVDARLDENDHEPGRLARAVIRVNADPERSGPTSNKRWVILAMLCVIPSAREIWTADSDRWEEALIEDGVDRATRDLVLNAANGVSASHIWSNAYTPDRVKELHDHLIELTRHSSRTGR